MVSSGLLRRVAHGVTTQKTPFFIVTAVKTSNLTSGVKSVVRGSCCVLVFLMVVYCNSESLPVFVVCFDVFFRVVYLSGTAC
jgi:hypothetical protein